MPNTKKTPVGILTKDPSWQMVRKSLLGQWKEKPDWACRRLHQYLGNLSTTPNDKIRIVMNYLTGTGFRTGRIKPSCVIKLRAQLSSEIKVRKARGSW